MSIYSDEAKEYLPSCRLNGITSLFSMWLDPFRPLKGKPKPNTSFVLKSSCRLRRLFCPGFPFRGRKGWGIDNYDNLICNQVKPIIAIVISSNILWQPAIKQLPGWWFSIQQFSSFLLRSFLLFGLWPESRITRAGFILPWPHLFFTAGGIGAFCFYW